MHGIMGKALSGSRTRLITSRQAQRARYFAASDRASMIVSCSNVQRSEPTGVTLIQVTATRRRQSPDDFDVPILGCNIDRCEPVRVW